MSIEVDPKLFIPLVASNLTTAHWIVRSQEPDRNVAVKKVIDTFQTYQEILQKALADTSENQQKDNRKSQSEDLAIES